MRIISGTLGGRRLRVPANFKARPTTDMAREALFDILGNRYELEGLSALDLFAGTGGMSLEFASRGAAQVTAVEMLALHASFIRRNADELGVSALRVVNGDAFRFVARAAAASYDIVVADPPYDHPRRAEIPRLVLESGILKPGGCLVLEHAPGDDYAGESSFVERRHYGKVNFSFFAPAVGFTND